MLTTAVLATWNKKRVSKLPTFYYLSRDTTRVVEVGKGASPDMNEMLTR